MQRRGFSPLVPDIHHARYGDLESVRALLRTICPPDELAAIFVEPIQGEGGYIVPPADFLPGLRRLCDEHGVLLVFDEVQSGMGRTGKMFASEHWGVAGDIVCLAKGIANGLPLGAIVARASVMDWPSGSHASTFGGNPVACAASLATLRLVEERYCANADRRGRQLREGLRALARRFPFIREVRGLGLMIGVEIQSETGEPAPGLARPDHRPGLSSRAAAAPLRPEHGPVLPAALLDGAAGRDRSRADRRDHVGRRRRDQAAEGEPGRSLAGARGARSGTDLIDRGWREHDSDPPR